ncbi:response regulator transcription factor [Qipengyuania sp. ASV99]|uniref:response regulator transcription factor n=1 Tax=Qipengyuania sp. ASV99 TaxID=3399681 RepID=UPI003A4C7624
MIWIIARSSGTNALMGKSMVRYGLMYGGLIALVAIVLQWAHYRYIVMQLPGEAYVAVVAAIFVMLGIWVGMRLTAAPAAPRFERNHKAAESLGLTRRECEILVHLAKGASNKEIARALKVSPNTVKTHVASLFQKLEVNGRGKAVEAARALSLIP